MARRVVITGIGVTAPGAGDTAAFWDLLTAGRTATRKLSLFDASGFRSRVAGECDFVPSDHGVTAAETGRLDRAAQFALACARDARADSGLTPDSVEPWRTGVTIGSAVGCTMGLEEEYVAASAHGRDWLVDHLACSPRLHGYFVPSSIAAEVAWAVGAEGTVSLVSTGCTSGIDSVAYAADMITEGAADVMFAGATDAPISPITVASFDAIRATTTNNDEPAQAARPFDRTRDGFVLAEGCAVMVLEEFEHARRRGARIYAEITGYASRSTAFHMTGLPTAGREMAAAIRAALDQSRLDAADIDYINAHGSGTKQNDRHETAAFKLSLREHAYRTPVSSIKSMIGHSLGAIGSLEIAACALAIEHDLVPPTANLHEPDPDCDLDYVPLHARPQPVNSVLTVGSGFGGFQSAMVLRQAA
jgi:act minimal PKS ketosynthase (KS/KS alpha)